VIKLQALFREIAEVFQQKRVRKAFRTFLLEKIHRIVLSILSTLSQSSLISSRLRFQQGEHGFFLGGSYFVTHNAGLMSCATTTLSDIYLANRTVVKIRSTFGMNLYKNRLLADNWEKFFQQTNETQLTNKDSQIEVRTERIHDWWSSDYGTLPLHLVKDQVETYFMPSKQVQEQQELFLSKYLIRLYDAVGVHYRGTDKAIEIETPSPQEFIKQTKKSLEDIKNPQILLLTDEPYAQEAFKTAFPGQVILIDELDAPGGTVGAHNLDSPDPEAEGQTFLAILFLISKCKKVVTHTGNGALWEVLFRGSTQKLQQVVSF
jgi:hypothetical protein